MKQSVYDIISEFYKSLRNFFPEYKGNPCIECNICCRRIANLGASLMETDYIEEFVRRRDMDRQIFHDFKEFIEKKPQEKAGQTCPFFSEKLKGCSIYEARPLSCRTFGCFINIKFGHLIPEYCRIRSKLTYYTDSDFSEKMPFVIDFYRMAQIYESSMK